MAYTSKNYQTKKSLKQDIADGAQVTCYEPGLGPDLSMHTGTVYLEGPHFPQPHKWYASAELKDGLIVKVK